MEFNDDVFNDPNFFTDASTNTTLLDEINLSGKTGNTSVHDLEISFYFHFTVGAILYVVFIFIRTYFKGVYLPKINSGNFRKMYDMNNGWFSWVKITIFANNEDILHMAGLDGYMFIKFLRWMMILFGSFAILANIIITPINATGGSDLYGLDSLTSSNINMDAFDRYWAHCLLAYFFIAATVYVCVRLMREYIKRKRSYLNDPSYCHKPHARTLFVGSIPAKLQNKEQLAKIFGVYPGGITHITINRSTKKLNQLIKKRNNIHNKMELAETRYIIACNKAGEKVTRPAHRTGLFGFSGPRVDSIDYYRVQLALMNAEIHHWRKQYETFPPQKSAFIIFNNHIAAHMAAQTVVSHRFLHMDPRHVDVQPKDMIWENLNLTPLELMVRGAVGEVLGVLVGAFWFFPVGIVNAVANLNKLQSLPGFEWIEHLNVKFLAFLQSILPIIAISLLNKLVPKMFCRISKYQGVPRKSDVELSVMHKYYWFTVITFIIGSTVFGSVASIEENFRRISKNSIEIFNIFAAILPPNSTFFIAYIILKALNAAAQEILSPKDLVIRQLTTYLFASTPRTKLTLSKLKEAEWGTLWADQTIIYTIGAVYCTIAPVVSLFITLYFGIFLFVYKYQMLFVYDTEITQSNGLFFVKSIDQIFAGIYLLCITFIGVLISVRRVEFVILYILLLLITMLCQYLMKFIFFNHVQYLPTDIGLMVDAAEEPKENTSLFSSDEEYKIHNHSSNTNFYSVKSRTDSSYSQFKNTSIKIQIDDEILSPIESSESFESTTPLRKPEYKDQEKGLHVADIDYLSPQKSKNSSHSLYGHSLEHYFAHPSIVSPQPIVWLPEDRLGIYHEESTNLRKQPRIESEYPLKKLLVESFGAKIAGSKCRLELSGDSFPEDSLDAINIINQQYEYER